MWCCRELIVIIIIFSLFFFILSIISLSLSLLVNTDFSLIIEFSFFNFYYNDLPFSFLFDYLSFLFFSVVCLISSVVFLFRGFYFSYSLGVLDFFISRYFFLLSLFVFSIFFLVFSSSFLVVMIGWDGLGLVSFLLVVYYNSPRSLDSGVVTVLTNRVGDCLFILRFLIMFGGGWFFLDFLASPYFFGFSFLVGLGCFTKSAQIPFSSWLPMAMAAPTPVSSLVHSSTLVTAGVYLIVRFNFLLSELYWLITPLSLMTMVVGGFVALRETDLKKVVAMSTLSQLGFIVFSVSLGFWLLGFFHIIFHAFFKRVLFIGSGNLIHYLIGSQDSRLFGSLGSSSFSKLIFCVGCLSLMGFPFSVGFYSKDFIIGSVLFNNSCVFSILFLLGCCLTVSYSLRLIRICFMGFPSFPTNLSFKDDIFFYLPVIFILLVCIFSGNFFLFNFFPPVLFSFLDFSVGLFVIFLGFVLFSFFTTQYITLNFFLRMMFLSRITLRFSVLLPSLPVKEESSWGEVLGGSGVFWLVSYLQILFKPLFYVYSLLYFLLVVFILFFTIF